MKVLVLSDFSEVAINATHYSMDMLHKEVVEFTLLNVALPTPGVSENERGRQKLKIKEKLEERVRALQKRAAGTNLHFQGHYCEENLLDGTRAFLMRQPVDLIVMGAVGADQRKNCILGEHTFEIMRKVKCKILAVPQDATFVDLQKILMPLLPDTVISSKHLTLFNKLGYFKKDLIEINEIVPDMKPRNGYYDNINQVWNEIPQSRVERLEIKISDLHNFEYWKMIQQKYDAIGLIAKNIDILDRLFNREKGILRIMTNRLPIFVLHD